MAIITIFNGLLMVNKFAVWYVEWKNGSATECVWFRLTQVIIVIKLLSSCVWFTIYVQKADVHGCFFVINKKEAEFNIYFGFASYGEFHMVDYLFFNRTWVVESIWLEWVK